MTMTLEKYENEIYHYENAVEVFEDIDEFEKWLENLDPEWVFRPNLGCACPIGQWHQEVFEGASYIDSDYYAGSNTQDYWFQDYYWRAAPDGEDAWRVEWIPANALQLLNQVRADWEGHL